MFWNIFILAGKIPVNWSINTNRQDVDSIIHHHWTQGRVPLGSQRRVFLFVFDAEHSKMIQVTSASAGDVSIVAGPVKVTT